MARSLLTDISEKLAREELELEIKLESLKAKKGAAEEVRKQDAEEMSPRAVAFSSHTATNLATLRENASKRNEALLKELQVRSAKLRSRTCFCPTELQVNKLHAQYVKEKTALHTAGASPPLDFSFRNLTSVKDLGSTKPRYSVKRYRKSASGLYDCHALRLNNNHLMSIRGIHAILYQVMEQPEHLTWLDLSFNKLTTISRELAEFSSLKIMYLHGNMLKDLGKVLQTLRCLPQLYSLTLHGNPLEEHKKYRLKILNGLPQLRSLDFTNVTVSDKLHLLKNKIKKNSSSAT